MQFILVSGRVPRKHAYCALCTASLEDFYCREIDTRIVYCSVGCFSEHLQAALVTMGGLDAEVAKEMPMRKGLRPNIPLLPPPKILL